MNSSVSRLVIFSALALSPLAIGTATAQAPDPRIAEAIRALPDDLQAGATVVVYEEKTGERKVLRQGTNMMECQPKSPVDGFTRCYHKMLAPRRDLEAKLRAQGKKDEEVTAAVQEAIKAGTIKPPTFGTMSYRLSDDKGRIQKLWVMSVPGATPESIGVSTSSQREEALLGKGLALANATGDARRARDDPDQYKVGIKTKPQSPPRAQSRKSSLHSRRTLRFCVLGRGPL